jgi:exopolysaccharide production protein ExoZ
MGKLGLSFAERYADAGRPAEEIVGIQYLRGLAAVAVVVDHAGSMAALPKYFSEKIFGGVLSYGALGVDVFFVISGFIITIVSLHPVSLAPRMPVAQFLGKRFIRIVPLMWIAIVSYAALRFCGRDHYFPAGAYARALSLIPYGDVQPNQIWTLRHELIFYVLFSASWLSKHRWPRLLLLVWFVAPALLFPFCETVSDDSFVHIFFSPVNLCFGFGFMLGLVFLKRPRRGMPANGQFLHCTIVMGGIFVLGFAAGLQNQELLGAVLISIISAGILWAVIFREPGRISAFGLLLGDASYAIYLFHPHFISFLLSIIRAHDAHMNIFAVNVISIAAAVGGGIAVHILIEKPLVRAMRSRFMPHRSVVAVA